MALGCISLPSRALRAGPSYSIETHINCADAMVEAHLTFLKDRQRRERAVPTAQEKASFIWLGGTKPTSLRIDWDRSFREASVWEWKVARRRGHMKVLLFLRTGPNGKLRSLVLGVVGPPNDVQKDYAARRQEAEAAWARRTGVRAVDVCPI